MALDLDDSQDPSGALRDIKQVSATALHDLRARLGVLRDQADAAPTAPASDLDALAGLADRAQSAGLHTDVDVRVNGVVVPSAIGGAAFRIVQEGLTNVLRHADASSARVGIRARSDTLDIEITDDGHSDTAGVSPGLGLRGMAERAAALGSGADLTSVRARKAAGGSTRCFRWAAETARDCNSGRAGRGPADGQSRLPLFAGLPQRHRRRRRSRNGDGRASAGPRAAPRCRGDGYPDA